ncbi:MAG: RsbRD N-terminal domain-containing protein [Candidatus Zixiibacteriota bacterium]|nr:MAG: RsbRD N-terminal domain-containing protein [candidate division Zixibacteria bacterium]
MKLKEFLENNRQRIVERWFQVIIETYPGDSARFLTKDKDRFTNPVGHTFSNETRALFDILLGGPNTDAANESIDRIIKIRAVQDFTPSQAVVFVFTLKDIIRESLRDEISAHQLHDELEDFCRDIDKLALLIFDRYMECREKINQIRLDQLRQTSGRLHKRLNVSENKLNPEGDPTDDSI